MAITAIETNPELLDQAAKLQAEVSSMQEKLRELIRRAGGLQVTLPELHDRKTGRIDVQKVAAYIGVPLKTLAEALDLNYKTVHRNSSAGALQSAVQPIKRSLEILHDFFQKPETIRVWLNTPHPDLDGHTALETILAKNSSAVLTILENAAAGVPV